MAKQKTRSEVDNNYKWDLTKIYLNDSEWEKDYELFKNDMTEISKFKGIITRSAKDLLEYLNTYNALDRRIEKLYMYAHLNHDADTTDTKYQEMYGKIRKLLNDFESLDSYANPELMSVDYNVIEKYDEEESLKEYSYLLENLYRFKSHILSDKEEELLSNLSLSLGSSSDTYNSLTDSDMKFGNIKDEIGEEVELTESNYTNFIHSSDRNVRKEAFTKLLETYGSYKNTLASTFSGNVKTLTSLAKIKNFNSSLEASKIIWMLYINILI